MRTAARHPRQHRARARRFAAILGRRIASASLPYLGVGALVLLAPAGAHAETTPQAHAGSETSTTTSSEVASPPAAEVAPEESGEATTVPQPAAPSPAGEAPTTAPEVQAQKPQVESASGSPAGPAHKGHVHKPASAQTDTGSKAPKTKAKANKVEKLPGQAAPPPSALTPPLPSSLGSPIGSVPNFFIESFRVPPFLLPIYQAAGTAYGIPWQVLAAINEVETDYGRDLSVSSAGAEGWMQFLPSSWDLYGVDANGDGYEDPYNPADAVFAAARYLAAAGGASDIRGAIYSYNHSQAYVDSVMLRAQLLGGTPPELLSAITGLTESRFPVHVAAHFADGFATVPGSDQPGTLAGTTIYAQAGAPVIAVQDGQILAVGDSPTLGHYISLRDAYGNTYTYAQLGSVADVYPVLEPRVRSAPTQRAARSRRGASPRPSAPASAGVQPHSPLSEAAVSAGLAMGATAGLEAPPAPAPPTAPPVVPAPEATTPHAFRAGPDEVYLHELRPGVEVLAGTVLGHLGTADEGTGTSTDLTAQPEAHMLFQIRPAGAGAPLIDPKPILDGWVQLENTSIFRAKGENPFLATSPTVGQVLLESKRQLELQVLRADSVNFASKCERGEVQAGQVDRRALAALEFLSVSGLKPTVSSLECATRAHAASANSAGDTVDISAINGTPIAGHEQPGSLADIAVHRLLRLQGTMKPRQIATGSLSYPGTANTLTLPSDHGMISLSFRASGGAREARALAATPLTPDQWLALISRLGEIPNPTVAGKPSKAAIPDGTSTNSGVTAGAKSGG